MFLRATWRRALLVAAVIPLGLLRNALRILVISLLCVHIGPHMINSVIHRRGGPFFFASVVNSTFRDVMVAPATGDQTTVSPRRRGRTAG